MTSISDALVEELAQMLADGIDWIDDADTWERNGARHILGRLVELGWRESCGAVTRGGDPASCELPRGHQDQRHADGNGVTWGACSLDRRADGTAP